MTSLVDLHNLIPKKPLIYNEIPGDKNQFNNVLLIDSSVQNYETFVNSVNSSTFPIVYSATSSKTELLALLQKMFSSISRIGFVFTSGFGNVKMFLDCETLFRDDETKPYSANSQFIIDLIKEFNIKNIDFLGCNTLNYANWKNFYDILAQNTGVIVGASNNETGNIQYGGDWVMESTSEDIEVVYFNNSIEYYTYLLDTITYFTRYNQTTNDVNLTVDSNYIYATSFSNNYVTRINLTTKEVNNTWLQITDQTRLLGVAVYNNMLYIAGWGSKNIVSVNLTTFAKTVFVTLPGIYGYAQPYGLCINNDTMYVSDWGNGSIIKIDMITKNINSDFSLNLGGGIFNLTVNNDKIYVAQNWQSKIHIIDLNNGNLLNTFNVGASPTGLTIVNNRLFLAHGWGNGRVNEYDLNCNIIQLNYLIPNQGTCYALVKKNNIIYACVSNDNAIYQINIDYPCFKEGSKILTDKGYKPIQDLRNGDLVKTLLHDYKPIVMIGKREIHHSASSERIKNQLYNCSQEQYPEIFEPLILTGCHSILVDRFTDEEQKKKVIEVNGNTYVTDRKYRLPACADLRASVYETPGTYTIYHLALEHEDYYMNYGIYANGLLVETCSKRYLKELSNMELIE